MFLETANWLIESTIGQYQFDGYENQSCTLQMEETVSTKILITIERIIGLYSLDGFDKQTYIDSNA